jgi:hypothetical protein
MMGRTEQRLRDTAVAMGEQISPADLPELRLAEATFVAPRWRGQRLVPVMAALAVLVLIIGATVVGRTLGGRHFIGSVHNPAVDARGVPQFLVTSVQAKGYVRSAATGRIIASIRPPVPGYLIEGIAARPGDRVFYLAGETIVDGDHGELEFYRIVLAADGQPGPARRVPGRPIRLPIPVSSDGLVTIPIAVSPDGRYLAFVTSNSLFPDAARQPAKLVIRNVATGASRSWQLPPNDRSAISQVSWAGNGQVCFVATIGDSTVANGKVVVKHGSELSVLMVLPRSAAGHDLAADSRLLAYGSLLEAAKGPGVELPGPSAGVSTSDGKYVVAQLVRNAGSSALAEISIATGKVTRYLVTGMPAHQVAPAAIDHNHLLFILSPRHEPDKNYYVCGHLADDNLGSTRITQLPFPIYCSTEAPLPPLITNW